jgi:hypothetical protein
MKLAQTSRKIALRGRPRRFGTALIALLVVAACGGRAKDEREPREHSPSAGGADSVAATGVASSGGANSGGQTEEGGTTADGGTGSSQAAGGSFGGAFESEDFQGSCRYVECEGCFRCVELYIDSGCGIPDVQPGHSTERSGEPCPREGLVAVCLEEDKIRYYYTNSDVTLEYLETYCVLVED